MFALVEVLGVRLVGGAWLSDRRIELEKMYKWMEDLKLRDEIIDRQMRLWEQLI